MKNLSIYNWMKNDSKLIITFYDKYNKYYYLTFLCALNIMNNLKNFQLLKNYSLTIIYKL